MCSSANRLRVYKHVITVNASARTKWQHAPPTSHGATPGKYDKSTFEEKLNMKELAVLAMMVAIAGAVATIVISTPQAYSAEKERRFPQLKIEELNEQQRAVADKIMKVSSVGISGPYNPMLRSPIMAYRMFALLDYLGFT